LTSVVSQLLGYDTQVILGKTGHAHNMGRGNWKGSRSICFVGNHWSLNYRSGFLLYCCHLLPDKFLDDNQHIQTIYIDTDEQDFEKVTELYVKKAWPDIWTPEEYKKWASPEYPPYSPDNIEKSVLIQADLINDFKQTIVKKWYKENPCLDTYKKLNFKTIMGIDKFNLMHEVCNIINQSPKDHVQQFISEYQLLNQKLYF
jgi:hypothetical protein